jgi:hypothetical protein
MDVKDFCYNIGKSLDVASVMESKDLRSQLFTIFYAFIDSEYTSLFLSRSTHKSDFSLSDEQKLLDKMTYANMVDSDAFKQFRRQAYNKLYCFIEIF